MMSIPEHGPQGDHDYSKERECIRKGLETLHQARALSQALDKVVRTNAASKPGDAKGSAMR
jgi:hypothetical protein